MALTKKLRDIADAIREKTGSTGLLTLEEMAEEIINLESIDDTYILVDEDGNECAAVMTEEPIALTATANDIRIGTTAVTDKGVIAGEKEIPAYHTTEGMEVIAAGKNMTLKYLGSACNFTKLQALFCTQSVSTEMVCINSKVYEVNDIEILHEVQVDTDAQVVDFGFTNGTTKPYVIRYFTYKEEY